MVEWLVDTRFARLPVPFGICNEQRFVQERIVDLETPDDRAVSDRGYAYIAMFGGESRLVRGLNLLICVKSSLHCNTVTPQHVSSVRALSFLICR